MPATKHGIVKTFGSLLSIDGDAVTTKARARICMLAQHNCFELGLKSILWIAQTRCNTSRYITRSEHDPCWTCF